MVVTNRKKNKKRSVGTKLDPSTTESGEKDPSGGGRQMSTETTKKETKLTQ